MNKLQMLLMSRLDNKSMTGYELASRSIQVVAISSLSRAESFRIQRKCYSRGY